MNQIKFRYRIKVIETGKILTQFYTLEELEFGLLNKKNAYKFEVLSRDTCTNLLDKNGKEIYERDIAICTTPTAYGGKRIEKDPVVWDEDGSWSISYFFGHCSEYDTVEVIGNIHENPELLK